MSGSPQEPCYHIFCDEFGDQSLTQKSSDFFIYSAVVVSSKNETSIPKWVRRINLQRRHWSGQPLHFTDLDERTKLWATRFIGKLPLRCFVIISHKDNMRGYRNIRAERATDPRVYNDDGVSFTALPRRKLWYSHIVLKVLLERATDWCLTRSLREYGEPRTVRITIAQRGGFYIDKFKRYLELKDRVNYVNQSGVLPRYLAWPVVDLDHMTSAPANDVAGLQLADVVSGAFSRGIDEQRFNGCDRRYAANLGWRIARRGRQRTIARWGVTGLPWDLWEAGLSHDQEMLFRMFGYTDEKLVRPGLILPVN
jgi:hypothetical protein